MIFIGGIIIIGDQWTIGINILCLITVEWRENGAHVGFIMVDDVI